MWGNYEPPGESAVHRLKLVTMVTLRSSKAKLTETVILQSDSTPWRRSVFPPASRAIAHDAAQGGGACPTYQNVNSADTRNRRGPKSPLVEMYAV